jgi:hypothetical protein
MSIFFKKQQDTIANAIKKNDKKVFTDISRELKAIDTKIRKIDSPGIKDMLTRLQQTIDRLN